MRLLLTSDTVGGVWTYAMELARALRRHDVQIALATMGAPLREDQWQQVRSLPHVQVFESAYKLEWMEEPWEDVRRAGQWLLDLESRFRPDVVHLNGYAHGALPFRAPVMIVAHSCVLSWWQAVKRESAPSPWDRYRREVARGLEGADLVVAPTEAMLFNLLQHYGTPDAVQIIRNGRDPSLFAPSAKRPLILAAGRLWDEAKNLAALERVAPRLPWPVHVAGEEQHPDRSGGRVQSQHLRALGRLSEPEMARWLAQASIYCLPARYEPFGLSILEAAMSRCTLVLGDIPSLRELWHGAAMFVMPDDTDQLEWTLKAIIEDEPLRDTLAAHARERAMRFTPPHLVGAYMDAYQRLIRRHRRLEQAVTAEPRIIGDAPGPSALAG